MTKLRNQAVQQVMKAISNISMQVEGLENDMIKPQLKLLGSESVFDSFAILLLLIELDQNLGSDVLDGHSLVEWFSALDLESVSDMDLKEFAGLLVESYPSINGEVEK
jgi:hypothetical protein|tara:strand:- start:6907 stop:7230 length:324 start_codon:yes stop_codon:yes gene_type:complete